MDLIERYNLALKSTENDIIRILNRVLDASFASLVRRVRIQLQAPYPDPALRKLALIRELRELVPMFRPDRVDAYDRIFRNLLSSAQNRGIAIARDLSTEAGFTERVDISIPIEATIAAAKRARGYLVRHGQHFAQTAAELIAQGIVEGRSTSSMVSQVRQRLGVVKSRAEVIVRTETLRAYNNASNDYYAANGIELVMWYATADDRACAICAPRAGKIYKRSNVKAPCHPRCRCYLAPWEPEIAAMDPEYAAQRQRHADDIRKAYKQISNEPVNLNRAAVFEQLAPTPIAVD